MATKKRLQISKLVASRLFAMISFAVACILIFDAMIEWSRSNILHSVSFDSELKFPAVTFCSPDNNKWDLVGKSLKYFYKDSPETLLQKLANHPPFFEKLVDLVWYQAFLRSYFHRHQDKDINVDELSLVATDISKDCLKDTLEALKTLKRSEDFFIDASPCFPYYTSPSSWGWIDVEKLQNRIETYFRTILRSSLQSDMMLQKSIIQKTQSRMLTIREPNSEHLFETAMLANSLEIAADLVKNPGSFIDILTGLVLAPFSWKKNPLPPHCYYCNHLVLSLRNKNNNTNGQQGQSYLDLLNSLSNYKGYPSMWDEHLATSLKTSDRFVADAMTDFNLNATSLDENYDMLKWILEQEDNEDERSLKIPFCAFWNDVVDPIHLTECDQNLLQRAQLSLFQHNCYTFNQDGSYSDNKDLTTPIGGMLFLVDDSINKRPESLEEPIKLFIHEPGTPHNNPESVQFDIPRGKSVKASIKIISETPGERLSFLALKTRKCLLEEEIADKQALKFTNVSSKYNHVNCMMDWMLEALLASCGCKPWHLKGFDNDLPFCKAEGLDCFLEVYNNPKLKQTGQEHCMSSCKNTKYTGSLQASSTLNLKYDMIRYALFGTSKANEAKVLVIDEFEAIAEDIEEWTLRANKLDGVQIIDPEKELKPLPRNIRSHVRKVTQNRRRQMSAVRVSFSSTRNMNITKDIKFNFVDQLGQIAGTLGMFVGISIFSLVNSLVETVVSLKQVIESRFKRKKSEETTESTYAGPNPEEPSKTEEGEKEKQSNNEKAKELDDSTSIQSEKELNG